MEKILKLANIMFWRFALFATICETFLKFPPKPNTLFVIEFTISFASLIVNRGNSSAGSAPRLRTQGSVLASFSREVSFAWAPKNASSNAT